MDDLIYRSAALACFPDWMDKNGHEQMVTKITCRRRRKKRENHDVM